MRIYKEIILLIIFLLIFQSNMTFGQSMEKTLIIVVDSLDFNQIEVIAPYNASVGLLNMKTGGLYKDSNMESLFMTLSLGRRVSIKKGLFKIVDKVENNSLCIVGYNDIQKYIKENYIQIYPNMIFLGETLKERGIGYIGNDEASLLAADKDGNIKYGENHIIYELNWIKNNINHIFEKGSITIISFNIDNKQERVELLKKLVSEYEDTNIIIFSKKVSLSLSKCLNKYLTPIIYIDTDKTSGILTTDTTRRRGVITNLDILPHLLNTYNADDYATIGHTINILPSPNPVEETKKLLKQYTNLNVIKYILHGIILFFEGFIILTYLLNKKGYDRFNSNVFENIIIIIFLSFFIGISSVYENIVIYLVLLFGGSFILRYLLNIKGVKIIEFFSFMIAGLMYYSLFFNLKLLYNSYLGYNNIIVGGRFYGINNEAMGVLIVTTIISYFTLKNMIKNKVMKKIITAIVFSTCIFSLSGSYGANVGGYLTSIALLMMIIYFEFTNKKLNKENLIIIFVIGIIVFMLNVYFDMSIVKKSHLGSLSHRVSTLGVSELIYIIIVKIKQLITILILPPWSVIMVLQFLFLSKAYRENKEKLLQNNMYLIIFVTSIIALLINDTGIIAFTFINTFLIAHISRKLRLL